MGCIIGKRGASTSFEIGCFCQREQSGTPNYLHLLHCNANDRFNNIPMQCIVYISFHIKLETVNLHFEWFHIVAINMILRITFNLNQNIKYTYTFLASLN